MVKNYLCIIMKNLLTYTALILTILSIACKKNKSDDAVENSYPETFVAKERRIISYVKVYTKDGEITDQKFLSAHLARDYEDFFRETPGLMKAELDTVIYLSADSLKIILDGHSSLSNTPGNYDLKASQIYKIKNNGNYTLYSDSKYLTLLKSEQDSILNKGVERFFKHKPFKLEQPPIFGMPYSFIYYYPFITLKSGTELKFPFVNIKFSQSSGTGKEAIKSEIALSVNNEFNEAALSSLRAGDTLAVQTSELIFEKK